MKPPSSEQIAWLKQSVAATGNTEHQVLLYLLTQVQDLYMLLLDATLQPQPADPPADTTRDLSSVAKSILDAYLRAPVGNHLSVAAVINRLADQAGSAKHWHVNELLAIATELEGGR